MDRRFFIGYISIWYQNIQLCSLSVLFSNRTHSFYKKKIGYLPCNWNEEKNVEFIDIEKNHMSIMV